MPNNKADDYVPPVELCASLQGAVSEAGLNVDKLSVPLETNRQRQIRVPDRHAVPVTDGEKAGFWSVPSLRELFRGDHQPPADISHYPPEYVMHFASVEIHLLALCDILGDRTDQEMHEVYSAIRRRPDGRSLGVTHDFIWQVAALLLGTRVLSEAEFEAIFGTLALSASKWALRPISRNYVDYLRRTLRGNDEEAGY